MKVLFTPTARRQFLAAIRYIKQDKPSAALDFRNRAEKALRRLQQFPESGRVIPEFESLPYRELVFSPYRFFYRIKGKKIWIVAVWHSAQIPETPSSAHPNGDS